MDYRPDIDGLRAVAVLAVLLYHVGVPGFSGGFVGVDVFFVISGYLICGMIDAQLRAGRFSLGDFYKRRIMRIVPALAVTMLATTVLAYAVFLPVELEDYAYSLIAAAASVSNMYFAYTAGYFEAPVLSKPLLHTWSLGVEEQFYVAAPLAMMLVARLAPARMRMALVLAAATSFVLAAVAARYSPTKAFYFAPFRAWEFLIGALLAVGAVPVPGSGRVRDAMGVLGLVLIGGTVVLATGETAFLVVTGLSSLGVVLVIASSPAAGTRSLAGRLLALRPFVFVGLVSYSVYLWHWPIFVFLRNGLVLPDGLPQAAVQILVIVLSLLVGYLSWRFVEKPFRGATARTPRRTAFAAFAGATCVLAAFGALALRLDGLPSRFPPEVVRLAAYLGYDPKAAFRQGRCYLVGRRETLDEAECLRLASDRPNYLLVGDSFAAHLWLGLSTALPGVNVLQASVGQCRPIVGLPSGDVPCARLRRDVLDGFLAERRVDKVLLAAAWKDEDLDGLSRTIDVLRARGHDVVVLGPLVEYQRPLPRVLADGLMWDEPSLARRLRDDSIPPRDRTMRALVTARGAEYVSLYAAACPDGACQELTSDGGPLQFDTGHLTAEGSIAVARRLTAVTALRQASAQ